MFRARKQNVAVNSLAELPERALEIHRMRSDVRDTFDLSTAKGRAGLYWWYYIHAFREMWLDFRPSQDLKGPVNAPVEHLPRRGPTPVTWLMREFWRQGVFPSEANRPRRQIGALSRLFAPGREPQSEDEQWRLASWYFCTGLHEYNLEGLVTPEQADRLLESCGNEKAAPLLLEMAHRLATNLHDRYASSANDEWRQWCAGEGRRRFPIFNHPLISDRLFGASRKAATARAYHGSTQGVNLVGHAHARSGVGEDLRMAAYALEAAGIPFVVRNVDPSTRVAPEEAGLELRLADHSPFAINIFCMAGMETMTMLAQNRSFMDGKVNIGFWPWELPGWPQLWGHAPGLMDELWASTSFTASAYRGSTLAPVRQVPIAVDVSATQGLGRAAFGLPEDRFLFGFAFDGHSSFSRKNPEGVMKAFTQAFPNGEVPVGLVLKGLRVDDHPQWLGLERAAARDQRIVLISESMHRGAMLDLYRSIDCFVSLHRSEGFGRNIAECMLLGKPVIVTNYSGNVDFTRADTAALVSARLQCIGDGEYPFGAGQSWADPNITDAVEHLRRIFSDKPWRDRIALAGQEFIKTHYSSAAVGKRLSRELSRIRERINNAATS